MIDSVRGLAGKKIFVDDIELHSVSSIMIAQAAHEIKCKVQLTLIIVDVKADDRAISLYTEFGNGNDLRKSMNS